MSVIEGAVQIQGGEPWPPNEYQQKSLVCESSRRLRRLELLCPVVAQSLGQTERRHVADLGVSANEVFSPSHETKHLWQLWVRALGLAGQDGGIELACRLELLPLGEERCDVCRRFQSTSASARQVESEESHRLFELGEQLRVLLPSRRKLLGGKAQSLRDLAGTDELDEALLLEVEEEERIGVENLEARRRSMSACRRACIVISWCAQRED